jgi:hypothetical protein
MIRLLAGLHLIGSSPSHKGNSIYIYVHDWCSFNISFWCWVHYWGRGPYGIESTSLILEYSHVVFAQDYKGQLIALVCNMLKVFLASPKVCVV